MQLSDNDIKTLTSLLGNHFACSDCDPNGSGIYGLYSKFAEEAERRGLGCRGFFPPLDLEVTEYVHGPERVFLRFKG